MGTVRVLPFYHPYSTQEVVGVLDRAWRRKAFRANFQVILTKRGFTRMLSRLDRPNTLALFHLAKVALPKPLAKRAEV